MREPRVTDRLEMLRDLIKIQKGQLNEALYKSIFTRAKLAEAKRNLVAHGIWADRDEGWYVELTRGSWPKNVRELLAGSRKIDPEMVEIDIDKLRTATTEIEALIVDLRKLRDSISLPPRPSPQKHP